MALVDRLDNAFRNKWTWAGMAIGAAALGTFLALYSPNKKQEKPVEKPIHVTKIEKQWTSPNVEPIPFPEPKIEPKVEPKPEPKIEPKVEPKIEPLLELKINPEPKPEPKEKGLLKKYELRVKGTSCWDIDEGRLGKVGKGMDVFWRQKSSTIRELIPLPAFENVGLTNFGKIDFDKLSLDDLMKAGYDRMSISGDDGNNHLTPGTIIGIRTQQGNYAKIRIDKNIPLDRMTKLGRRTSKFYDMAVTVVVYKPGKPIVKIDPKPGKPDLIELTKENIYDKLGKGNVVVDVWAEWCGPCKKYGPIFEGIAGKYNSQGVTFAKLDFDVYRKVHDELVEKGIITEEDKIKGIPRTLILKDGKLKHSFGGANGTALENNLKKYYGVIEPKPKEELF